MNSLPTQLLDYKTAGALFAGGMLTKFLSEGHGYEKGFKGFDKDFVEDEINKKLHYSSLMGLAASLGTATLKPNVSIGRSIFVGALAGAVGATSMAVETKYNPQIIAESIAISSAATMAAHFGLAKYVGFDNSPIKSKTIENFLDTIPQSMSKNMKKGWKFLEDTPLLNKLTQKGTYSRVALGLIAANTLNNVSKDIATTRRKNEGNEASRMRENNPIKGSIGEQVNISANINSHINTQDLEKY